MLSAEKYIYHVSLDKNKKYKQVFFLFIPLQNLPPIFTHTLTNNPA